MLSESLSEPWSPGRGLCGSSRHRGGGRGSLGSCRPGFESQRGRFLSVRLWTSEPAAWGLAFSSVKRSGNKSWWRQAACKVEQGLLYMVPHPLLLVTPRGPGAAGREGGALSPAPAISPLIAATCASCSLAVTLPPPAAPPRGPWGPGSHPVKRVLTHFMGVLIKEPFPFTQLHEPVFPSSESSRSPWGRGVLWFIQTQMYHLDL